MADTPSPLSVYTGPLDAPNPDFEGKSGGEGAAAYMQRLGLDQKKYEKAEAAYDRAAEEAEDVARQFKKRLPAAKKETEAAYGGLERALDRPRPAVPNLERVESPPKPEDYHKMSMEYLGAMVMLGAFGGKFIRNAANAPLAAFNGALTGWQEGNLEAYKEKSAEWKEKQQQVLDNNRARLDEYRLILEDHNASIQDQMDRVKLVAAKNQDKLWYDRADVQNFTAIGQLHDKSLDVHERAQAATDKLVEQWTKTDETATPRANQWGQFLATPQGQQWFEQFTKQDPGAAFRLKGFADTWADQAPAAPIEPATVGAGAMTTAETPAATQMPPELRTKYPPTGMHGAALAEWYERKKSFAETGHDITPERLGRLHAMEYPARTTGALSLQQYIDDTVAETGKPPSAHDLIHFRAEQVGEEQRGRTAGGMSARSSAATDEVAMALPLALTSSRNLPRGRLVPFNQLMQAWEKGTSDKRYNDFMVKNISLLNAYVRAMNPQGNPRIAERMEAHAVGLLSMATDQASYEVQLRAIWQEVVNQRKAIAQTRADEPHSDEFPEPDAGAGAGAGGGAGSVIRYDAGGNRIK